VSTDDLRIDRRKFLRGAAGVAGAAAFASWAPWAQGRPGGPTAPIVGKNQLACQHFSVRDATTRVRSTSASPVMGYLGGPNFPQDPTDLGPLVPLPGGYQEVFQFLGECGYGGFEFFQSTQNAENAGGANPGVAAIRGWLDSAGIKSVGTHQGGLGMFTQGATPGTGTINATGQARRADAAALGHTMIGTAGDPSGANTVAAWQAVCANYSKMGELMLENYGIKVYLHPEQNNWNFIADPAVPVAERQHRIDFWVANTDPRYVFIEPDIFHMYNARARFPNPDGTLWDPISYLQNNWKRLVGWHVKDANRTVTAVAPPGNAWEQTAIRPGFPLSGGVDVIYSTEGHLANGAASAAQPGTSPTGYGYDPGGRAPNAQPGPDPRVWSFRREFTDVRSNRSKGFRYHIVESDSGPGPASDPGRSLRHAKYSAKLLLGLK
jgi:sugar phosphate isomerase/epimerase